MAYEPQVWADGAEGGTPLSAVRLNRIEQGIAGVELTPGPEGPKGDKGDKGAAGSDGAKGAKGDTGEAGVDGFPTEAQWNDLVARVEALETPEA